MTDTPLGTFVHDVSLDSVSPESLAGFRLIDERGCLTDEVLCFVEELRSEQRDVVERHLLTCSACTFQHHQLIQAAQMMRRARPRVRFSSEARVLGRRAVVRAVLEHQPRYSEPSDRRSRRRRRWLHIGLVLSLALMILALSMVLMTLLSGCHRQGSSSSRRLRARFTQGERQGRLAPKLTAATGSPQGGRYAGGTQGGDLWILGPSGTSFRLAPSPTSRPESQPASRPSPRPGRAARKGAPRPGARSVSRPVSRPMSRPTSQPAMRSWVRHDGAIAAVDFSGDGRHLLSVGGRMTAYWKLDISKKESHLVNYLRGPQVLTVGLLGSTGREAFFGTDRGYVMRWRVDRHEAQAMSGFRCRVHMVSPARIALPKDRRCPHGTYDTNRRGQGYCAYPATHLTRRGTRLALACRDGYVNVLDLSTRRQRYRLAGALGGLAFVTDRKLVFARRDGRIQLYDSAETDNDVSVHDIATFGREAFRREAGFAAAAGALIAIGAGTRITLLPVSGGRPAGVLGLAATPVWLGLEISGTRGTLTTILEDGQVLRYPFTLHQVGTKVSTPEA